MNFRVTTQEVGGYTEDLETAKIACTRMGACPGQYGYPKTAGTSITSILYIVTNSSSRLPKLKGHSTPEMDHSPKVKIQETTC